MNIAFVCQEKLKSIEYVLNIEYWHIAMQEELN